MRELTLHTQRLMAEVYSLEREPITSQEQENILIEQISKIYNQLHKIYDNEAKKRARPE